MATATLSFLTESLWKDHCFSDIKLEFSGHDFRLHRLLLCQSPFLKRLLEKTSHAKSTLQLPMHDSNMTVDALDICLSTLYGLEPVLDEDNVIAVLATAFVLELDMLCDMCLSFLPNLLTPTLFLKLHAFNETWEGKEYSLLVTDLLERYLCRTAYNELRSSLHKLPCDQLRSLFSSNALWVPSESERFQLIMEVYRSMRQTALKEAESIDQVTKPEARRTLSFRHLGLSHREATSCPYEIGRSASTENPVRQDNGRLLDFNRVNSTPVHAAGETNSCKNFLPAADCDFLESVLCDDKIFYACFSFLDLIKARNQAQRLGLRKVVQCIEKSLWTKSILESMIISEATKLGDVRCARSIDAKADMDSARIMSASDDNLCPCFRYSTEIEDIEQFRSNRDFTSEQFYFCGSLFRIVLTLRFDENNQDHFVGMFLQRTIISNEESWQFCDPRSNVNVHVEFIAGTRMLELIELDGRLEVPHNNKGYSRFLHDSDLEKYLSPSRSLRITTILKLIFDGVNPEGHC